MTTPQVNFRSMQLQDVERVMQIDQLSFTMPWPKSSFRFELEENDASRCWVAEVQFDKGESDIIGIAVVWQLVDQAHIATIAIHPEYRQMGIGTDFLFYILEKAQSEGMLSATLEVRETNLAAQSLYRKFGFQVTGRRRRYYHDTQEDALIMTMLFPVPAAASKNNYI